VCGKERPLEVRERPRSESISGALRSAVPSAPVLSFAQLGRGDLTVAGGMGANLSEMTGARFSVPPGFCLTTGAYRHFLAGHRDIAGLFASLEAIPPDDVNALRRTSGTVRERLERLPIPALVEQASYLGDGSPTIGTAPGLGRDE
jgi:Pyruvate phosphate dikinase, AMP/ATP-binding domain